MQNGRLLRERKDLPAWTSRVCLREKNNTENCPFSPNGLTGLRKFKSKLFVANQFIQKDSSFEISGTELGS